MTTNEKATADDTKFSFSPRVVYEITINPDDKHQFVNKKDTRVYNVKESLKELLSQYDDTIFHLYPEMSMPQYGNQNKNRYARVHFHGIICFKTDRAVRKFLLDCWHRLTGSNSIQFNHYRKEHWTKYCRKQRQYFKKVERLCNSTWEAIEAQAELGDAETSS